jgi:hypothetical protein
MTQSKQAPALNAPGKRIVDGNFTLTMPMKDGSIKVMTK